jgi:hypothetical protein
MTTGDRPVIRRLYGTFGGSTADRADGTEPIRGEARRMAERVCAGFQLHDDRRRREAIDAFLFVDARQFPGIPATDARAAAEAYVDALWAKDAVEDRHRDEHGEIDAERIATADWSDVRRALLRRTDAAGIHERYAERTTLAWRNHKARRDYWTPFMDAQRLELRAALDDPAFPAKPREGQSGYGPLVVRYVLGVELHDAHTSAAWREAIDVMTPYYRRILAAHGDD